MLTIALDTDQLAYLLEVLEDRMSDAHTDIHNGRDPESVEDAQDRYANAQHMHNWLTPYLPWR